MRKRWLLRISSKYGVNSKDVPEQKINMLHYIYSRSFISVITVMVLALAAWGALPARVGARRWRRGNLVLVAAIHA